MKPILKNLVRPEVSKRAPYHLAVYPKAIKLNQNEFPYDLPLTLKKKLFRRLAALPFQRYPLTQPERLRRRLAKILRVRPGQIQVCNGSNVMIQALILTTAVGGRVMIMDPTFGVYEIQAGLFGNQVLKVPLDTEDFSFSLKTFLKVMKAKRPQIIFLANPNAPTGNLLPTPDIVEILRQAKCLVVVDEAYYSFSKITLLPYLKKFPNLVILRTFSKGFGLGGVRVGYMVAREEISQQVEKVLLPYCLNILSEETALFALDHQKYFQPILHEVIRERERMFHAMRSMKGVDCFPSAANFLLFRVKDSGKCFRHLLKKGVLVRDVSNRFHLRNCLRVSVGKPKENEAFLRALGSYSK